MYYNNTVLRKDEPQRRVQVFYPPQFPLNFIMCEESESVVRVGFFHCPKIYTFVTDRS